MLVLLFDLCKDLFFGPLVFFFGDAVGRNYQFAQLRRRPDVAALEVGAPDFVLAQICCRDACQGRFDAPQALQ